MAAHAVAADERGVHRKTLVAATVDTVTFARDVDRVEVLNLDGAAEIFFTLDGTAPTVGGNNSDVLPAAVNAVERDVPSSGATVVKLISSGTPMYSVVGIR